MAGHANFVHLRVHSAFSLLEGAMQPDEIARLCQKHKMPAVAVTDTNNLFGLYDITDALTKAGVQPILGIQLSLHVDGDGSKRNGTQARTGHDGVIVLLVQSEKGYANLMKLASKAHLDVSVGEAPHVTWPMIEQYHEGLVALTGGPKGLINKLIVEGQVDAARGWMQRFASVFGDRLYVELQRHGVADEVAAEVPLVKLAYELELPLVATNEPFFGKKAMFEAHDALLCVAGGAYLSQEDRRKESEQHYFKSAEEMTALFRRCARRDCKHDRDRETLRVHSEEAQSDLAGLRAGVGSDARGGAAGAG